MRPNYAREVAFTIPMQCNRFWKEGSVAPVSEWGGAIARVVHKAKSRTYFTFVYDGKSFRSMRQGREARSAEFFSDLRSFGYAVNS